MPTTRATSTPSTSVTALTDTLRHQLDASTSATIYVPVDDGDTPTDDELKALLANGLHVELDVVHGALAVRRATDDEIAEATAPPPPIAESTASA